MAEEDLIKRLERIREAHGWTQAAIAGEIGFSEGSYRAALRGDPLGVTALRRILRAFPELDRAVLSYLRGTAADSDRTPEPALG
jgi:transcriptional regulator with XRE-family HTH domain